jgi:Uma2 family endonuclease
MGEFNMGNRATADLTDKSLSTATAKSLDGMTETEFVAWCDEDVRAEYVDGKVIIMSLESVSDERLQWFIGTILQIFVESHDLGEIFGPNLQIRLKPRLRRIPDLLFISRARLHLLKETHFEGAPDLAIEIVSPKSEERDERDKYREYEAAGIHEYWVIAPLEKRVDLHRLTAEGKYEPFPLKAGGYHSTVIPGFFLKPKWLWCQPTPKKRDILIELGL